MSSLLYILVALALGGVIGLEREVTNGIKKESTTAVSSFGGIRSYALISLVGAVCTTLDIWSGGSSIWLVFGMVCIFGFTLTSYIHTAFRGGFLGLTTEYAAIVVYMIGALSAYGHILYAIVLTIILSWVLSSKKWLRNIRTEISRTELSASIKFGLIAVVILPLLPDVRYAIADIVSLVSTGSMYTGKSLSVCTTSIYDFGNCVYTMKFVNPYSIWKFVVLMTAVEYIGYVLSQIYGAKSGIILSGAIGGLVSSTAVTAAMAKKSLQSPQDIPAMVVATLLANSIMFVRVLIIVAFIYPQILSQIYIPALGMFGVFAVSIGLCISRIHTAATPSDIAPSESPFQILPAIKFALFIVFIKFLSGFLQLWGIQELYYILAVVSGLADVDVPTLEFATRALDGIFLPAFAGGLILVSVMSNNMMKGLIAWKGGHATWSRYIYSTFILSGIVGVVCMWWIR